MKRIAYLDSIRGIAAFAVFFSHFAGGYGEFPFLPHWTLLTPLAFYRDGAAAVAIFFVLSGLVLTRQVFEHSPHPTYSLPKTLGPFLTLRFFRICVPFFAAVLLSAAAQRYWRTESSTVPAASGWISAIWADSLSSKQILRQLFLPVPAASGHLVTQDWTLTIETNVSMMMPFLTLIATQGPFSFLFFILLFLKKRWFLAHFAWGILISKYFSSLEAFLSRKSWPFKSLLFLGAALLYNIRHVAPDLVDRWIAADFRQEVYWYASGLGAAGIILFAMSSRRFQCFLEVKPLVYLGKISYSLFLLHFAVLKTFTPFLLHRLNVWGLTGPETAYALALVATSAVVILISDVSYRWIEEPAIRIGRRLAGRLKSLGCA
jgi:peptidoglycan/LPS O-acetylase OafA/YrhL